MMPEHDNLFEADLDLKLREHIAKSDHNFSETAKSLHYIIAAANAMLDRIEALEYKVKGLSNG